MLNHGRNQQTAAQSRQLGAALCPLQNPRASNDVNLTFSAGLSDSHFGLDLPPRWAVAQLAAPVLATSLHRRREIELCG